MLLLGKLVAGLPKWISFEALGGLKFHAAVSRSSLIKIHVTLESIWPHRLINELKLILII